MIEIMQQIADAHKQIEELKENLALLDAIPEELQNDLQNLVYEIAQFEYLLLEKDDIIIPNL